MATFAKKLIQFAKNCSRQSTGSYLVELVNDYNLEEKETVFVAVENGEVVGFAAFLQECVADVKESHEKMYQKYGFSNIGNLMLNCGVKCTVMEKDFEKR